MTVGIDLGTTYSRSACLGAEGRPVLIPDCSEPDAFLTPSVVHLARDAALVGSPAEALQEQNPRLPVVRFFKRQLGARCPVGHDYRGIPWYSEGVAALLLKKLVFDAEAHRRRALEDVVVAVPPHFNDPQRRAVLAAAALADVSVAGLVEAPAAVALHYAAAHGVQDQVALVYDFGGGGFDAAVVSMDARGVYVLAKAGLTELGGKELDEQVIALILSQLERAGCRPFSMEARALPSLRRIAEQVKIDLSAPGRSVVRRTLALDGRSVELEIARADFDVAIRECLNRTEAETMACLWDAGLRPRDVHRVLMVGGSSRVPLVEERLRAVFGLAGQQVLQHEPGTAVAYGAALHGSQLTGEAERLGVPPGLFGVTAHGVGVRTLDPATTSAGIDVLVKRNTPLPVRVTTTYQTSRPFQQRVVFELVQFHEPGDPVVSLGRLVVGPLRAPRPHFPVRLTVECRQDGTVNATAYDASGCELTHAFSRPGDDDARRDMQRALVRATTVNDRIH